MPAARAHDRNLGRVLLEQVPRLPRLVWRAARYRAAWHLGYMQKPRRLLLYLTRRCSMRCVMCPVIEVRPTREPSVDEVRRIIGDPVLDRVRELVLTGGEPTLRDDLAEIVATVIEGSPRIAEVWLTTNAGAPRPIERQFRRLVALPGYGRLKKLGAQISIDGVGETHERIRRLRAGTFAKIVETIARLKRIAECHPLALQINCTVQRENADRLQEVADFAAGQGIPVAFTPAIQAAKSDDDFARQVQIQPEQIEALRSFFGRPATSVHALPKLAFWRDYLRMVEGAKRRFPCALPFVAVFISAEGDVFPCATSGISYGNIHHRSLDELRNSARAHAIRQRIRREICSHCTSSCVASDTATEEVSHFARFLLGEGVRRLVRGALPALRRPSEGFW